ncbi:restriction endonuclease subunit R [Agreia sp. Leaf244]|uniref:DEAD/DEAH box helicase family protein n=1 Tax=Agreia sp. Leaf244 TaxID=1736305 RepID=UPI0006FD5836|nr:DEAD/DEAH box helicase family protein [Agreia sp. Leaf244]KQO11812.1 restriction endonuclease subunit R [Agreia sp. Leaf244]
MSNFDFVRAGWPALAEEARRSEFHAYGDPRSSLFYARRALELTVRWLYTADSSLRAPYKDDLVALLYEPRFKQLVGAGLLTKMDLIRKQGNNAVHRPNQLRANDSVPIVRELFHVLTWLATHYAPTPADRPVAGIQFDVDELPKPQPGAATKTREQLLRLGDELAKKDAELDEARARNEQLAAEVEQLQRDVDDAKQRNAVVPDTHDYREDDTRDLFIDLLLKEAGWNLDDERDTEYPVDGMPNKAGQGFVDYVLWGDDGMPLGLVEAKRTAKNPGTGQQQAKLYADALERQFRQRPVIFYTNGFEHWIWDDLASPPRPVAGFYTRDELALLIQRRTTAKPLASLAINDGIADRYYQQGAVRRVAEVFDKKERRALLVMATGSGKTRTVIALTDLLLRANRAKRILFLADRVALVKQSTNAFKSFLPDSAPVNLVTDKETEGRVFASTYPTMMGLIDSGGDGLRRFGPGYFDLIVIDEAHRSVYAKYGAIFTYFDALLVGLTATPKDEVDHNTYSLFALEDGVPTDSYDLERAIGDGFLVPPVGRSVTTQFVREGIRYAELSDADKERWESADWGDDAIPDEVDAAAVNNWLFNTDTVDKVLEVLMTEGHRVAGGDRLGKTIVFARNNAHAVFIEQRFNANYPEYAGHFARIITHQVNYAQSLIDDFSKPHKLPQIAISVDMLDTGIDVPDVVNLVFFKPVHSKTKYWQMVGRGTRLRPDLYAPGVDKANFIIFDVCQNIEYFNEVLAPTSDTITLSLGARLFHARLALLACLDAHARQAPDAAADLLEIRKALAGGLHQRVAGMNEDNFLVRARRRSVSRFAAAGAWTSPSEEDLTDAVELANLPSAADALDTDERARRFDLFALRVQLGVLQGDPAFVAAKKRIQAIADALLSQKSVPAVGKEALLLDQLATEEWWADVTVPMLEDMRLRLRGLVYLIDSAGRSVIYTDFADTALDASDIEVRIGLPGVNRSRFLEKARHFLRSHAEDLVLAKVRLGHQLTVSDLTWLETIMIEQGEVDKSDLAAAALEANGLGLFVRSVVGLDRAAATDALGAFTGGVALTANQHTFVDLLVEQLTRSGVVSPRLLYSAPFVDVAPQGPEDLFSEAQVTELVATLKRIQSTAEAS